jgi:hypothetical protein
MTQPSNQISRWAFDDSTLKPSWWEYRRAMQFPLTDVQPPSHGLATGLMKLREGQCRFIVNEPPKPAMFCAAPTPAGSSWCAWHRTIVYAPPRSLGRNR